MQDKRLSEEVASGYTIPMRLTALWALSESGLGGFMHALKIPFTGFFLGGFAVVIIVLIAHYSRQKFRQVVQATILVILVKASVSPHSPPMAYIAVAFQGLSGALILQLPFKRLGAVIFGMTALFESAVQKFLVMTLIFGRSIWDALDLFFKGILKDFAIQPDFSFSFWLIGGYTFLYTTWGAFLGWWAYQLPAVLQRQKEHILLQYSQLPVHSHQAGSPRRNRRNKKLISAFFILLFTCSVFLLAGDGNKAVFALLRTVAAILILFFMVNPLIKWLIIKWASHKQKDKQPQLTALIDQLPVLRSYLSPAMQLARTNHPGLLKYPFFVVNLIVLALYHIPPANER